MLTHEKLDIYQISIKFVAFTLEVIKEIPKGNSDLISQLRRAATSIAFNIAEGAGKMSKNDKKRFYLIARGSATESASIYDILFIAELINQEQKEHAKSFLKRIIDMLSKLCIK